MLKNISKTVQQGFTLIELMIVIAIIGILAALAIPAYQDYLVRTQASEGLAMASAAKASVAEFRANRGSWPPTIRRRVSALRPTIEGKYVAVITVTDGGITVTYGNEANAEARCATPSVCTPGVSANGDVIWKCGDARRSRRGGSRRLTATDSAATTIADKYLPALCRGVRRLTSDLRSGLGATGAPASCGGSFFRRRVPRGRHPALARRDGRPVPGRPLADNSGRFNN